MESLRRRQSDFVSVIKQHERLILRVCALYDSGRDGELRDLYQDAVCALWEAYASFRGDCKISTWIYSVTRYTMLAHIRKQRIETYPISDDDAEQLQEDICQETALEEMRDTLALLEPDERNLLVMWLEGFELQEIASTSGLNYGVVATRLTRIKSKLRKLLNPNKERTGHGQDNR